MNDGATCEAPDTGTAMASESAAGRMTLWTWLGFLVGSRRAILTVANSRQALWLGLLFTLTAGFPREYDGAYLLRESWHLLLPLAASLATTALLLMLVYLAMGVENAGEVWPNYRTLLTFFWMTAPLAWLYAIPVERFLDPASATGANFGLLAIVSLWRVMLISRALSVWLGARFFAMLTVTVFFGTSVALVLTFFMPTPIWDIMGGIRLSEQEQFIVNVKHATYFFGGITWVVSGIATVILNLTAKSWGAPSVGPSGLAPVSAPLWGLAGVMLLAGIGLIFITQDEQRNRWEAERMLRGGAVAEAFRFIAARPGEAFPPHWDLPPRTAYGEKRPAMAEVLSALTEIDAPEWMWDIYVAKLLAQHSGLSDAVEMAEAGEPSVLFRVIEFLRLHRRPGGEFAYRVYEQLRSALEKELDPAVRTEIIEYLTEMGFAAGVPPP